MAKIYKYVGLHHPGDYYVIPIFAYPGKLTDWTTVSIAVDEDGNQKIAWGLTASQSLLDSPEYYKEVGEIDLNDVVIRTVMESVKEENSGGEE